MVPNDLYGHICLDWGIYNAFPSISRFKFRVWRAKNGEVSAENHQNDPWENENTTFPPDIFFYMAENDLYGYISLVWGKWNASLPILIDFLCSVGEK